MDAGTNRPAITAATISDRPVLSQIALVLGGTVLLALSAQVRLPLPFTPVPATAQTFAVLFLGLSLGSRKAGASAGGYWLAGACGLPVFNGWSGGWSAVTGPTGGYLIGFAAAAFVIGWFSERGWARGIEVLLPLVLGEVMIYAFGLPWLACFVGPRHVLQAGLFPFLAGDAVKLAAVMAVVPGGWWSLERMARLR